MDKIAYQIWLDYSELSWRMIWTLKSISLYDIPDNLKENIIADIKDIEQQYLGKKAKYEKQI